jgi:hypothetical protein
MRTTIASPRAVVETPTTIAVRISTCGNGFEYSWSVAPGWMMGAVPPSTLSMVMYMRNTADWKIDSPSSFLTRLPRAMTA